MLNISYFTVYNKHVKNVAICLLLDAMDDSSITARKVLDCDTNTCTDLGKLNSSLKWVTKLGKPVKKLSLEVTFKKADAVGSYDCRREIELYAYMERDNPQGTCGDYSMCKKIPVSMDGKYTKCMFQCKCFVGECPRVHLHVPPIPYFQLCEIEIV